MVRRRGEIPLDKETIDVCRNSINEFLKVSRAAYADQVTDVLLLELFESRHSIAEALFLIHQTQFPMLKRAERLAH